MASSSENRDAAGDTSATGSGGATPIDTDYGDYYSHYGYLSHQKEMLCDRVRMEAYHSSVFKNQHHFKGKTVLDVGTGSGILAIWAAQAGAKKVYAVESTRMFEHAGTLVKAHNLENVVEVIAGKVENVTLPKKVDVIISEWMGHFLLRESMFDSVIFARDRWLKPTGVMYPSHARMWMAPIKTMLFDEKMDGYEESMKDWDAFVNDTKEKYDVDMSVLSKPYSEEMEKYYLQTSLYNELYPDQVIGTAAVVKEMDCLTATLEDVCEVRSTFLSSINDDDTIVSGFVGWFDVHFRGRKEDPAQEEIELTTAPSVDDTTHWLQQVFLLSPPAEVVEGDSLDVSFVMTRSKEDGRSLEIELVCDVKKSSGEMVPPIRNNFFMQ